MAYVKKGGRTRRNAASVGGATLICGLIVAVVAITTIGYLSGDAKKDADIGPDLPAEGNVSNQQLSADVPDSVAAGLPDDKAGGSPGQLGGGTTNAAGSAGEPTEGLPEQTDGGATDAVGGPDEGILDEPDIVITERDGISYLSVDGHEMILVNKEYGLPSDYGDGITDEAAAALDEMTQAAAEDGIGLWIVSGFRSYDTQLAIHERYVNQYGSDYADRISALAGQSEHQTGLAFDLNSLSESFSQTAEYAWLCENAARYGFILRYPEGKEWATGYVFEPWHYRYVGTELAEIFAESGLSVEEYAGIEHSTNPEVG